MDEFEKFYGTIRETSIGVLQITIPKRVAEFAGWKSGDVIKVLARKAENEEADNAETE